MTLRPVVIALYAGTISVPCPGQSPATPAEQMAATEIMIESVGEKLYVFYGFGGNIVASIGDQGVLIVDNQFPEMVPKYRAAIRELGGGNIDFGINTHWHYDHADGNKRLGPEGTWLVSQENSRDMMTRDNVIDNGVGLVTNQPAYPAAALPIITFERHMRLHFNGEEIDLLHFAPAHSNGDAAVVFRDHNAIHLGDVFNNIEYPFIDTNNGGDLDGMITFCEAVLQETDSATIVIPGHGPVANAERLLRYVEMLRGLRDQISELIDQGASLEQVIAAEPTTRWDAHYGNPSQRNKLAFIGRAYESLSR